MPDYFKKSLGMKMPSSLDAVLKAEEKECPEGKVFDPESGECVDESETEVVTEGIHAGRRRRMKPSY